MCSHHDKLLLGRRSFLASAGAAAFAGSPLAREIEGGGGPLSSRRNAPRSPRDPQEILAEAKRYRKIDSHNHIDGERISARMVIESADRLGIERVAISLPHGDTPDAFRAANDLIIRAIQEFPGRFVGQCYLNPHYPREARDELIRCLDAGFIGMGELYTQAKINDPVFFPLIELSIDENAPVMMHARADVGLIWPGRKPTEAPLTSSVADDFVDVARRYPEGTFIHAHIGGGGDWEYMCKTLRDVPNVLIDTSGSIADEGMVDFAKRTLGIERMHFATDLNFETGVGKVLAADLSEQERRRLFWDNYNDILRMRDLHAN